MFAVNNFKEPRTHLQRIAGLFVQPLDEGQNTQPTRANRFLSWFDQNPFYLALLLGLLTPIAVMSVVVLSRRVLGSESELLKFVTMVIAITIWQPLINKSNRRYLVLAVLISILSSICLVRLNVFGPHK